MPHPDDQQASATILLEDEFYSLCEEVIENWPDDVTQRTSRDYDDPLMDGEILLVDTFDLLCTELIGDWPVLMKQRYKPTEVIAKKVENGDVVKMLGVPHEPPLDQCLRQVNLKLRTSISRQSLIGHIRDDQGNILDLSPDGWMVNLIAPDISSSKVAPGDLMNPGPIAEAHGRQRSVFFYRRDVDALITNLKSRGRGRPSDMPAIQQEAKRRVALGKRYLTREALGKSLESWIAAARKGVKTPKAKSILANLRDEMPEVLNVLVPQKRKN